MTAGAQASVRLRCPRGAFWSALMPTTEAEALANEMEKQIVRCGDGWDFVGMAGYDGRDQRVRGREVFAVEVIPESALAEPRRLPTTVGGVVTGVTMTVHGGGQGEGGEAPGTAFLRRQAADHPMHIGGGRR